MIRWSFSYSGSYTYQRKNLSATKMCAGIDFPRKSCPLGQDILSAWPKLDVPCKINHALCNPYGSTGPTPPCIDCIDYQGFTRLPEMCDSLWGNNSLVHRPLFSVFICGGGKRVWLAGLASQTLFLNARRRRAKKGSGQMSSMDWWTYAKKISACEPLVIKHNYHVFYRPKSKNTFFRGLLY